MDYEEHNVHIINLQKYELAGDKEKSRQAKIPLWELRKEMNYIVRPSSTGGCING